MRQESLHAHLFQFGIYHYRNLANPTLCYGQDGLLQELLKKLSGHPCSSFGIAGGRRMGKTTLLRRVETELQTMRVL